MTAPLIVDNPENAAPYYLKRRSKLSSALSEAKLDAYLVTHMVNVSYLTGFTGSSATLLITTDNKSFFLTDFRYTEQASRQVTGCEIIEYKDRMEAILGVAAKGGFLCVGVDPDHTTLSGLDDLNNSKVSQVEWTPVEGLIEKIRLIKDDAEMEVIRWLASLLAKVYQNALSLIRPGRKERDVAIELEYLLMKEGADQRAFDFIVASGERSAMPHGVASDKIIRDGELVTLDWGAKGRGYHTDNTRTIALGSIDAELQSIYDTVLKANRAAIRMIKPGVTTKEIDNAARSIIEEAGFGEQFGHGTGHGVGADIHEKPTLSKKVETVVESGMLFTIEPGIYLPGKGGVRIEDMVYVTETGCEVITAAIPIEGV